MVTQYMLFDHVELVTLKMDKPSAFLALAVETVLIRAAVPAASDIFKAGRTSGINVVLIDKSFVHQLFKMAVNRGRAHGLALVLEIITDFRNGQMPAGNGFKIIKKLGALLGFIFSVFV